MQLKNRRETSSASKQLLKRLNLNRLLKLKAVIVEKSRDYVNVVKKYQQKLSLRKNPRWLEPVFW
jgi:hypothetical protein